MKDSRFRTGTSDIFHIAAAVFGSGIFITLGAFFLIAAGKAISPLFLNDASFFYSGNSLSINWSGVFNNLWFTLKQAFVSLIISVAIGVPAAYYTSHKSFAFRKFLLSFSAVPLCIPALIVALGYISSFGMAGTINSILQSIFKLQDPPIKFLYSFWGIVICQGFYNFPLIMATLGDTWSMLDTSKADSARLLGAGEWRTFWTVSFWQLLPSLISACIPVFLYCFFSFMIVQLFGGMEGSTLEVSIYHAAKSTLNFRQASLLSIIETCSALFILLGYNLMEKKSASETSVSLSKKQRERLTPRELPGFIIFTLITAVFFLLPVACIILQTVSYSSQGKTVYGFKIWKQLFAMKGFLPSLKNTITIGFFTGTLCTLCGLFYSVILKLTEYKGKDLLSLKIIGLLPFCVSSVTMGFGIIMGFKKGSPLTLVLCQSCLSWPFAFRQIYAQLKKMPSTTMNQSLLLSRNTLDMIFRTMIPYGKKGILSAFGFCFAISAGDATLPLVLAIPKFDTLGLFIYRLAGSYRLKEACCAGLILGLLCMTIYSIADRIKEK